MAASNSQPFSILDFSGGITDHIFEQVPNQAAMLDNFLVNHDKKPYMRYGSELDDSTNPEITTGTRVSALVNYANSDILFYQSNRSIFYRNPSIFSELLGPTGNMLFSAGSITSVAAIAQWNRHLYLTSDAFPVPMKIFKDSAGNYQLRNAGLPDLATAPTVIAGASGTQNFVYAFHYTYDYSVFDLDYESIGPVTEVAVDNSAAPEISAITITGFPVLANGPSNNFDTSTIKIEIYRTTNDGTFFQKVGEVTNGTTSFTDSMSDTTLENVGIPLYTNDGTVDYDPVPLHKYNHVVNNTSYFVHLKDSDGKINPYKFRQSVPGVPDSAPIDFEGIVDDETTGVSSVRNIPIIFCKRFVFRIEGSFDQFGRGSAEAIRISDTAGCISHNSAVQCENGLFWLGNDGVYYTDGYVVQKISDDNNDFYKNTILKNTTQPSRIIGKFYEKERLVIWTIQQNASNADNDSFLVLDLKWGLSNASTFTTWSGNSFRPSALEIFNRDIYRGDPRGFTFHHKENLFVDRKIDLARDPSDWASETIVWRLKTIHYNFDESFFRKMPTRVLLTANDVGNTTIQINAINDDGKAIRPCKPIRIRRDLIWRDDDFVWRVSDIVWRGEGLIQQWRRFPAKPLRLSFLQLEITNGFSDITNSDTLGVATFDGTANTVTLTTSGMKWPIDCEDYYIYSEDDDYVQGYLIGQRVSDTVISITDPTNILPSDSGKKWVIRGYKKGEPLYLLGLNIHWTHVSASQDTYRATAAALGENE